MKKTRQEMGGDATLKKHGKDHYRRMSEKGVKARKSMFELARKAKELGIKV